MKIIAVEEHLLTPKYLDYLATRKAPPRREFIEEGGKRIIREWWSQTNYRAFPADQRNPVTLLGRERLKIMDEAGIDMQIISLSFPGVERMEPESGTYLARIMNDEIADQVKQYPDRFAGMAVLAPQDPQAATDELERAVKTLGLKGAMINGNIRGEYLDEQKYWPIFAMAEKLDVPVYIHPGMPSPEMIKPFVKYPGLSGGMLGFAAETSLHAMRLILSGLFDKYPKLKIVLGHLGEALPFWLWRIDSQFKVEQWDPVSAVFYKNFSKAPSEIFKSNFYVTTSGMFWPPAINFVKSVLGSDKIMFAADFPYESSPAAVICIRSMRMSKTDKEKICHLNAEKLFGL